MKNMTLGRLSVAQVYECDAVIPLADALPGVTGQDLARLRSWFWDEHLRDDPGESGMRISVHSYVLRIDDRIILIDTCCVEYQPVEGCFLLVHHERVVRALGHAETALEAL